MYPRIRICESLKLDSSITKQNEPFLESGFVITIQNKSTFLWIFYTFPASLMWQLITITSFDRGNVTLCFEKTKHSFRKTNYCSFFLYSRFVFFFLGRTSSSESEEGNLTVLRLFVLDVPLKRVTGLSAKRKQFNLFR